MYDFYFYVKNILKKHLPNVGKLLFIIQFTIYKYSKMKCKVQLVKTFISYISSLYIRYIETRITTFIKAKQTDEH